MQHCKKASIFSLLSFSAVCSLIPFFVFSSAFATDGFENNGFENIGCYLSVPHKTLSAQRDLLSQIIQMRFPKNINTKILNREN